MDSLGYFLAKVKSKFHRGNKEIINDFFRNHGVRIGKDTKISSNILSAEPYLISIGNNVTISHDVDFITHDNSVCKLYGVDHDLYGEIIIGDNCFIGAHSIILYGVQITNNVIVAAGSIITKSITQDNVIVAGNPARIIGTWDHFRQKTSSQIIHAGYLDYNGKKNKVIAEKSKWVIK